MYVRVVFERFEHIVRKFSNLIWTSAVTCIGSKLLIVSCHWYWSYDSFNIHAHTKWINTPPETYRQARIFRLAVQMGIFQLCCNRRNNGKSSLFVDFRKCSCGCICWFRWYTEKRGDAIKSVAIFNRYAWTPIRSDIHYKFDRIQNTRQKKKSIQIYLYLYIQYKPFCMHTSTAVSDWSRHVLIWDKSYSCLEVKTSCYLCSVCALDCIGLFRDV